MEIKVGGDGANEYQVSFLCCGINITIRQSFTLLGSDSSFLTRIVGMG